MPFQASWFLLIVGFFLGDGPGVGKGRQIASLVFENILRGRTKAIWFSASGDLALDAQRDFHDIGALRYEPVVLHDLKHCKAKPDHEDAADCGLGDLCEPAEIDPAHSEFGEGSRLQQMVDWLGGEGFDGALVFDECHRAKNCIAKQAAMGRKQNESKTSRAVVEIQRRLPNARVLYVSATGATEAENLCYMTRLGLWGDKTAFRDKLEFVNMLQQRGVAAMELVAMELKQSGSFIARTLSYEGVEFDQINVNIPDEYKQMYDAAAAIWLQVKEAIDDCKESGLIDPHQKKLISGQYYSAQLRFFRQLCTAAKVDTVSKLAQKMLDEGKCVVIGLQSTGEARTEAMVAAKEKATGADDNDFDSFVEPASLILSTVIKFMPASYPDRARLLEKAENMKLPGNPLDELIERLGGVDAVAEMSGRKRRMVKQPNGVYKYCLRSGRDIHLDKVNIHEKDEFQNGNKLVAVISDAASTGISLQADRSKPNQRQRVHITLELAWSADKTVQQLGRTHRSNQLQPPKYLIVSTDISGEHRFASAVACRLQQLGALTHGDRHAASAADALNNFNLQNKWATAALRKMYKILLGQMEPPDDVTPDFIQEGMSEVGSTAQQALERLRLLRAFIPDAKDALEEVDVLKKETLTEMDKQMGRKEALPGGNINKLLNRLLGCQVDIQSQIFSYFTALQDAEIKLAKANGTYDDCGIIKPHGESIAFRKKEIIYQDDYSGMCTYHAEFQIDRGMNYDAAVKVLEQERKEDPDTQCGFFRQVVDHNQRTYYVLALPRDAQGRKLKTQRSRNGRIKSRAAYYRIVRPAAGFSSDDMSSDKFHHIYTTIKESASLKVHWNEELKADSQKNRRQSLQLITGSILQILPTIAGQLRTHKLQVMRVESTDGKHQEIGLYLNNKDGAKVLDKVRSLQPYKPWQFKTMGTGQDGTAANLLGGVQPAPGGAMGLSQSQMNGAAPRPELASGILDLSSSPDASPVKAASKGGDKENRPRVARAKGEKRAKRTSKASAAASTTDLVDVQVAEPEHMLAAGLWEDIALPALKKAEAKKAAAEAKKPARKAEPLCMKQPEDQRAKFAAVESDEDAESPVAVMLKSRKLSKVGDSSAERGRSASTDWETLRSNSAVSEGWQVKCKCGVTVDDGKPMAECDGGCKTWVHIQCHKIKAGADFYCDQCTEGVQTSKSRTQQDDPVSEPMADSDAEDNDHVENGAGPGGYGPEEEAVPALMSRKSKAAPRSPTPDAAAGAADRRPDTGAEKTSVNCKEPAGAAAKDPEGIPSGKKKNKKGKLGVTEGRVTKGGKRGRMSLKALALSSAEARSPNASPDAKHAAGVEAAVQGGTPGKRRRSLLPPAMLNLGPVQASTSRDDVASEAAKWRSRCAELEAAAAKVKVMEQERASREAAGEADLRRSIEASLAERVKEEKLKLSRKALELGKQKGMQEAENKSQAQLQALRAEKQAAAEQLKAAQSDMATAKQRLHTAADKQASLEGITRSTGARAVPMTPHTPGHMEGADEAQGGVDRGLPACTPAKTVLEFDAASESAARAANSKQVKGVSDSGKKRVSWAPLPMVQDENCDEAEEAEVVSTPVTREAVLTWLEGVTTASLEDITEGLTAKQQMPALSDILQELQSDFEIATKAGRYFML
ncbi:hypothetical protein WJX79_004342 [Trebouxia sp. C0005]